MAQVEYAVVDVHVCPVGSATLGDAELADDVELLGRGIDQADEAPALVVDV